MEGLGAGEAFVTMTLTNPARILRDEMPIPVQPIPLERGLWAKVRGLLDPEGA
jgi:hypothetical protein